MKIKLYVVGKYMDDAPWEFVGVFLRKKAAIKACKTWRYYIAPLYLGRDVEVYHGTTDALPFPELCYPIVRE